MVFHIARLGCGHCRFVSSPERAFGVNVSRIDNALSIRPFGTFPPSVSSDAIARQLPSLGKSPEKPLGNARGVFGRRASSLAVCERRIPAKACACFVFVEGDAVSREKKPLDPTLAGTGSGRRRFVRHESYRRRIT